MKKSNPYHEWLMSDEGKTCADYKTLLMSSGAQTYLQNRLYLAYAAGMIKEYETTQQLQKTIEYYEERVKKLKTEIQEKNRLLLELQQQPSKPPINEVNVS